MKNYSGVAEILRRQSEFSFRCKPGLVNAKVFADGLQKLSSRRAFEIRKWFGLKYLLELVSVVLAKENE